MRIVMLSMLLSRRRRRSTARWARARRGALSCLLALAASSALPPAATADDAVVIDGPAAQAEANDRGIPVSVTLPGGGYLQIRKFRDGRPYYYVTGNVNAAASLSTNQVQPGGSSGLGLTGTGVTLGIWDGGATHVTHRELFLRSLQFDGGFLGGGSFHATHVAGTMIASGVDPLAKGMSPEATLRCFDWDSDESEMRSEAARGLRVSNHSYGFITGWLFVPDPTGGPQDAWWWFGDVAIHQEEDAYFGYYSFQARDWDQISVSHPRYLWCKAAGNDRGEGPNPGTPHIFFNPILNYQPDVSSTARVRDGHHFTGYPNGYDSIGHAGTAKNGLTVGAILDLPNGYQNAAGVNMSSFSCWGPTDDGRIKPDIVGNGVDVFSSTYNDNPAENDAYATFSGTSMATPNVSGSIGLLLQHYRNTHPGALDPLSSTMKALIIHTADEAGPSPGPDYVFGWGVMNTLRAANVLSQDQAQPLVMSELTVSDCYPTVELHLTADGGSELRATICWIDRPPDDVVMPPDPVELNPTTPALVNDLDLRITRDSDTHVFLPWVLSRGAPAVPATTGDNTADNVEQIVIPNPGTGTYTLRVTSKGLLDNLPQTFGIVITGASQIIRETVPAVLVSESPPRGTVLGALTSIVVHYNECVRDIGPDDIRINGRPARSVSGTGSGPYTFTFENPGHGPVNIELLSGVNFDFADNPFAGAGWTYTILDCNGNQVLDTLDVQNGTVEDCNGNFIPDLCDPSVLKALVGNERTIHMGEEIALGEALSAQGGVPPYRYAWTLRGNSGEQTSDQARPVFAPSKPGVYVARLVVTDSRNCQSIAYLTINVDGDDTGTPGPGNVPTTGGGPSAGGALCGVGTAAPLAATLVSCAGAIGLRRRRRGRPAA